MHVCVCVCRFILLHDEKIPLRHIIICVYVCVLCSATMGTVTNTQGCSAKTEHNKLAVRTYSYTHHNKSMPNLLLVAKKIKMIKLKKQRYTRTFLAVLKHALIARCSWREAGATASGDCLASTHHEADKQMDKLYIVYAHSYGVEMEAGSMTHPPHCYKENCVPSIWGIQHRFGLSPVRRRRRRRLRRNPAGGKKMLPCLFL